MREIVLILCVIGIFIAGYFLMKRIDKFLIKNYQMIKSEEEIKEPSFLVLSGELPRAEILEEIQKFQEKHEDIKIVICESKETINKEEK